jgi:hypothetical protein
MRRTTRSSASASAPSSGSGSGSQAPAPAWTYDQGPDPGRALVDPRLSMPFGPDGAAPHNPSPYPLLYTPGKLNSLFFFIS